MDRWLTPDAPSTPPLCRRLLVPDGVDWQAIVAGALLPLTKPYNFEAYGTQTPDQAAQVFMAMFDDFTFNGPKGCRVIGEIICYAGATSPDPSWLPCDGASLLRASYPDLFAAIGTTYGSADGTHFNLPDLRGRAPIDMGTGPGLSARSLGDSIGEEAHTLTTPESASHSHTDVGHSHADTGHTHVEGNAIPTLIAIGAGVPAPSAVPAIGATGIGFANIANGSANNSNTGGGAAHNNMQPSLALNFLIVAL